ncbi:CX domain-containing protein [Caenorhabditis elegans]|uniref:CX domain-containing protein n=1 Tax=Caenorhabditis elegans TaxID=6239 RepID=A8DZ52_CAEEL|nr:CX domain-containing protein [Caenorhabditis elegans]CAP09184.1 CX domain-containing protein [Caenorhabditis elegans]|eukprot:NP_001122997.1 Uncharacterized protein CELE_T04C12.9 [Caenorhabditis elegans]
MFKPSNCSIGNLVIDNCGFGKFCCMDGCCIDFTYVIILLIVVSMIVTVAIFIHVEVMKERRFNEKLIKHIESLNNDGVNRRFEETRIFLGASPIESCPFNLPPSCSPPMTVPKLKFHKNRPIRQFLHKHL